MAYPRVFISSTCYDLADVRDNLIEFIESFGFVPILSENGDIFYHPDLHTHESCIKEIENCNLFILIIGGRFGGKYVADLESSIVNAEYKAAKKLKIPVFTFIKNQVHEDHRLYSSNKTNAGDIIFPSIEKQEYAIKIFDFMDSVRRSKLNNGYFPFRYSNEIKILLRKQWSGMFYDFLQTRESANFKNNTKNALNSITLINEKIEDLVKSVLKTVDDKNADQVISDIELKNQAQQFFNEIKQNFILDKLNCIDKDLNKYIDDCKNWYDFIIILNNFEKQDKAVVISIEGKEYLQDIIFNSKSNIAITYRGENINESDKNIINLLDKLYSSLKSLPVEIRKKILNDNIENWKYHAN